MLPSFPPFVLGTLFRPEYIYDLYLFPHLLPLLYPTFILTHQFHKPHCRFFGMCELSITHLVPHSYLYDPHMHPGSVWSA